MFDAERAREWGEYTYNFHLQCFVQPKINIQINSQI